MRTFRVWLALLLSLGALFGCVTARGPTLESQRQDIRAMRDAAFQELVRANPAASQRLKQAEGYAVFSKLQLQVLFFSGGAGYGLAHDNQSGEDVFMRVAEAGVGLGVGVKDLRLFFVFHERAAFERFIVEGLEFGVEGEATAISGGDTGAGLSGRGAVAGGVSGAGASGRVGERSSAAGVPDASFEVFQFTENGLMLQVNLVGTRYWKDADLN